MSQTSGLTLVNIELLSKAKRFFWVFKPKEPILWEFFDLKLTFRNDMNQRFEGGLCQFTIQGNLTHAEYTVDVPPIESHEEGAVTESNLRIAEPSYHALTEITITTKDGKAILCKDTDGGDIGNPNYCYPVCLTTREEIYQKYAVLVALATSIVATVLTIVNVIVTIYR